VATLREHIGIGVEITQRKGVEKMTIIKRYEVGQLNISCNACGGSFTTKVPSEFTPKFLEEFGQYENLIVYCPMCKEKGNDVTIHINMNLPEGDLDEEDVEYQMPLDEINARKYIRDLMWDIRPDLKGKDRTEFNRNRPRVPRELVEAAKKTFGSFDVVD
jgi:hypothetical protein